MSKPAHDPRMRSYRMVLVSADTGQVFVRPDKTLPQISIPMWKRSTRAIQEATLSLWKCRAIVLDFMHGSPVAPACVSKLISPYPPEGLVPAALDNLGPQEISAEEQATVAAILRRDAGSRGPFSRIDWIDEAIEWIADVIGISVSSLCEIEQYNASGSFALLRFRMTEGRACWLKATGEPNRHELPITAALAAISPESLPPLLAVRDDWNAWLMEEAGESMNTREDEAILKSAIHAMAALQKKTIPHAGDLLTAGAIDHRIHVLKDYVDELMFYLEEVMARQISTRVPRLSAQRLREIGEILNDACLAMEALTIPDTIHHNDINAGNLLVSEDACVFTDWCEASIGNPFVTLEHLLSLLPRDDEGRQEAKRFQLKKVYRECWRDFLWDWQMDGALALMPLLGPLSALYGRGDWLRSVRRHSPDMQSYARSLARQIDRAALAMEASCL
jgi:hypothetical protein